MSCKNIVEFIKNESEKRGVKTIINNGLFSVEEGDLVKLLDVASDYRSHVIETLMDDKKSQLNIFISSLISSRPDGNQDSFNVMESHPVYEKIKDHLAQSLAVVDGRKDAYLVYRNHRLNEVSFSVLEEDGNVYIRMSTNHRYCDSDQESLIRLVVDTINKKDKEIWITYTND